MKRYGRSIKGLEGCMPFDQVIYFICYRYGLWDNPLMRIRPTERAWSFFTTEEGRNKALQELLESNGVNSIEVGQFCLADFAPKAKEVIAAEWKDFADRIRRVGEVSVYEDDPYFAVVFDEPQAKVLIRSPSKVVLEAALRREELVATVEVSA